MNGALVPCGRCESPLAREDLRCVICGLNTPADESHDERAFAEVLRCDGCGAAVTYTVKAQAPACAFCGDVMHLEKPDDPIEQAESFLRFTVGIEEAQDALRHWLGSLGFFRPSDLRSQSRLEELVPLYWVAWVCNAEAKVSWTADSNAGALRSSWAPHAGQQTIHYDGLVVPATRGLRYEETEKLTPHYDRGASDAAPSETLPATIERFDVQRSAARQRVLAALKTTSASMAEGWVPGSRLRNLNIALRLRKLSTERLALPAYVMAYRYRGTLYRAIVHGQNASCTFGAAPISWRKVFGVAVAAVFIAVSILWLVFGAG